MAGESNLVTCPLALYTTLQQSWLAHRGPFNPDYIFLLEPVDIEKVIALPCFKKGNELASISEIKGREIGDITMPSNTLRY